jgi:hypothetical protein
MRELEITSRTYWPSFWNGNKNVGFDEVLALLEHVRDFYKSIDSDAFVKLPLPPTKFFDKDASMRIFASTMSNFLKERTGLWLDSVVQTLVAVVFDLEGDIEPGFVRAARRRQQASRPLIKA